MPNALYQGKRKVRRKTLASRQQQNGGGDSTDSDELDHSDSGYSSPMHRQNQTSSGTDAGTKSLIEAQPGSERSNKKLLSATVVTQPSSCSVRQTSSVFHTATLYNEHEHLGHIPQSKINGMNYASALATKQTVLPVSDAVHSQEALPTADMSLGLSCNTIRAQLNEGAMSEQEDAGEDGASTGKKKRRKRGRRRKRKGISQ